MSIKSSNVLVIISYFVIFCHHQLTFASTSKIFWLRHWYHKTKWINCYNLNFRKKLSLFGPLTTKQWQRLKVRTWRPSKISGLMEASLSATIEGENTNSPTPQNSMCTFTILEFNRQYPCLQNLRKDTDPQFGIS